MLSKWKEIIDDANSLTKAELSDKISSFTTLTSSQALDIIQKTGISQQDFTKVIDIVKNATDSNNKKATALSNIGKGVEVLIEVAKKFL